LAASAVSPSRCQVRVNLRRAQPCQYEFIQLDFVLTRVHICIMKSSATLSLLLSLPSLLYF
jgi:hypothetical protein